MAFDSIIANPGRLQILTALASDPQQGFVQLRQRTGLTDGNLSTHARRLSSAGMIEIRKSIRDGKPTTDLQLTRLGRQSLEDHVKSLRAALDGERSPSPGPEQDAEAPGGAVQLLESTADTAEPADDSDWVD